MKHTPGPWTVGSDSVDQRLKETNIAGGDGWHVALVSSREDSINDANSKLIAAAPEMLEALQAFVITYEKSLQLEKTDIALRMAKNAIEKATK